MKKLSVIFKDPKKKLSRFLVEFGVGGSVICSVVRLGPGGLLAIRGIGRWSRLLFSKLNLTLYFFLALTVTVYISTLAWAIFILNNKGSFLRLCPIP